MIKFPLIRKEDLTEYAFFKETQPKSPSRIVLLSDCVAIFVKLKNKIKLTIPNIDMSDDNFLFKIPIRRINPHSNKKWNFTDHGDSISLSPSYLTWHPYQNGRTIVAHFFLRKNCLDLCSDNPFKDKDILMEAKHG